MALQIHDSTNVSFHGDVGGNKALGRDIGLEFQIPCAYFC